MFQLLMYDTTERRGRPRGSKKYNVGIPRIINYQRRNIVPFTPKFINSSNYKAQATCLKKYGIDFFNDIDQLEINYYTTLQSIANKYSISRERIRQLFGLIKGYSYTDALQRTKKSYKNDIEIGCVNDPRYKVAEYVGTGSIGYAAKIEYKFYKICEKKGYEIEISCDSLIDLIVNGYHVDVKSSKTTTKTGRGKVKYHHYSTNIRQKFWTDFFVCYHLTRDCFFIIPSKEVPNLTIYISEHKTNYYTSKNRYWEYKDAWHLLEK